MPRVDFKLWDRVYILKLICTAQMTYSSFITLVYFYLIILQSWTSWESTRSDILKFKCGVIVVSILEFGLGILLAFAANMTGVRCRRRIIAWLILETFLVPTSISLLMQLYYRIINSTQHFTTDPHYTRVNLAQVCFLLCQYIFIGYALDFLVHTKRKPKMYDPSIRPESVYAPTDPQITTTESRHIRISQSFLFQPSSSKKVTKYNFNDEGSSSSSSEIKFPNEDIKQKYEGKEWDEIARKEYSNYKQHKENLEWLRDEDTVWSINEKNSEKITLFRNAEKVDEKEWEEEQMQQWMVNIDRDGGLEKTGGRQKE